MDGKPGQRPTGQKNLRTWLSFTARFCNASTIGLSLSSLKEFLPGFQVIPAVGHRPDHTVLSVSSAGKRLLHLADSIIHPIMIEHAEWRWPGHSLPEQAMNDRQQLLERAAGQNALVFGSHFPFPGLGYVVQQGEGWRWQPIAA